MKEQLTVKEAIEQGYTHYSEKDSDYIRKIAKLDLNNWPDNELYLVEKEGYSFTISAKSIEEIILEKLIDEQDVVYDEDSELSVLASGADFETLANDINKRMESKKFFDVTDITLTP